MSKLQQIKDYLGYLTKARNQHGIHSPFLYDFYNNVIKDETPFYVFDDIESIRAKLLLTKMKIVVKDLGAGSKVHKSNERTIASITKTSVKPAKQGQLLFRLVNCLKPATILELGTSMGISTIYLAKPSKSTQITTVEGCENIAKVAQVNFDKLECNNITLVNANFDDYLPKYLTSNNPDMVFFDGNHTEEATLRYFKLCVTKAKENTVFVFDDINWSEGMKNAWSHIINHPKVTTTVNLHSLGLVFFTPDLSKENFLLRF